MRPLPIAAGCVAPKAGSVGLVGGSIVARFVEAARPHKKSERALFALGEYYAVLAVDIAGNIHRPLLRRCLLDVSVGTQNASRRQHPPGSVFALKHQAVVVSAFAATTASQLAQVGGRQYRAQVHPPADGARTVKIACAAAYQLDALDCQLRLS